jgi:hypothetical protein
MVFSSESSLPATPVVISERPVILISTCCSLGEGAITTYSNVLGFDAAA